MESVTDTKNRWWVLLVSTSATALIFLDNTVIPVALPTIGAQLGFSEVGVIWVVNSYLLALMTFLLVGGRLYDLIGMRRTYCLGVSIFGMGAIIGALSFSRWSLLLGRVIQGAGGALSVPTTGALLIATFPPRERARAIGINTGISSLFMILGPAISGLFTQYLSWRYIFWMNVPIILFGIFMALKLLPRNKQKEGEFHLLGAFTSSLAIVSLVVALMQGGKWGWNSLPIIALFIISAVFITLFTLISRREEHPLIDFAIFRSPLFRGANLMIFLTQFLLMVTILWAIYFQEQLGFSPLQAGLLILFATFPVVLLAPLGGYLADRFEPRVPIMIGFGLLTFAFFWMVFFASNGSVLRLFPGLIPFGSGVAMILSPSFATAMSEVDETKLGGAAGMTTISRQLASTLGIATLTAVFQGTYQATQSYASAFSVVSLITASLAAFGFFLSFIVVKNRK